MAKEELIEMRGLVEDILPDPRCSVKLENRHELGSPAARMACPEGADYGQRKVLLQLSDMPMPHSTANRREYEDRMTEVSSCREFQ